MKLWVLRHGEAEPRANSDAERRLTAHGREQVLRSAKEAGMRVSYDLASWNIVQADREFVQHLVLDDFGDFLGKLFWFLIGGRRGARQQDVAEVERQRFKDRAKLAPVHIQAVERRQRACRVHRGDRARKLVHRLRRRNAERGDDAWKVDHAVLALGKAALEKRQRIARAAVCKAREHFKGVGLDRDALFFTDSG